MRPRSPVGRAKIVRAMRIRTRRLGCRRSIDCVSDAPDCSHRRGTRSGLEPPSNGVDRNLERVRLRLEVKFQTCSAIMSLLTTLPLLRIKYKYSRSANQFAVNRGPAR